MTPEELKGLLLVSSIKIGVVFAVIMIGVIMIIWVERRGSALLQDRLGPNRVGPLGLLQNVADGLKNFTKEEVMPLQADPVIFVMAPMMSFVAAMLLFAVVPFAAPLPPFDVTLPLIGHVVHEGPVAMVIANLPVGFLFILAVSSIAVYGIVLAGWSSNSKYAFLGALRASAQMISYEIPLAMSLVVVLLLAGNVPLGDIIAFQQQTTWFVFAATLSWLLFHVATFAETNRMPFDLAEAEAELVAGFHTEYSSMKFAMFFIAEYTGLITMSALIATLFFGGWDIPFTTWDEQEATNWSFGTLFRVGMTNLFFIGKTFFFAWVYIWVRWTVPRFRFDQVMHLGWKILLPISLGYIVVMASAVLVLERLGMVHDWKYGMALFAVNVPLVALCVFGLDRDRLLLGARLRSPAET